MKIVLSVEIMSCVKLVLGNNRSNQIICLLQRGIVDAETLGYWTTFMIISNDHFIMDSRFN